MSGKIKLIVFVGVIVVMGAFANAFPDHKESLIFMAIAINVGFMQYHKK